VVYGIFHVLVHALIRLIQIDLQFGKVLFSETGVEKKNRRGIRVLPTFSTCDSECLNRLLGALDFKTAAHILHRVSKLWVGFDAFCDLVVGIQHC
jgi:hypothetical protein